MSVITEVIYLKLGVCVLYPQNNPYYQGRQFKMHFSFQNYAPFLTLTFYPAPHIPALAPACGALVLFS